MPKSSNITNELSNCVTQIDTITQHIFKQLKELANNVNAIWQAQKLINKKPTSKDLNQLRSKIDQYLLSNTSYLCGIGLVIAPQELDDEGMFLTWQKLEEQNKVVPLLLNFNKRSESYYNYIHMPWFIEPKATKQNTVAGPYVDIYGADMYIFTFAVPILIDGHFVGIAGADVPVTKLERLLLKPLVKLATEAVIITKEGRIIASNTSNWTVGEIINTARIAAGCHIIQLGNSAASSYWTLISNSTSRDSAYVA